MFSLEDVAAVNERMLHLLRAEGADLDAIEICPHHPDYTGVCDCRKPAPGMLRRAAGKLQIDLAASWMIGDRLDDLEAGSALGLRTILVRTGYGRAEERAAGNERIARITKVVEDLQDASAFLLSASPRAADGGADGEAPAASTEV
jgi:D-glycero-D-manno-heptose 1,7-bisphosphate phosphatase